MAKVTRSNKQRIQMLLDAIKASQEHGIKDYVSPFIDHIGLVSADEDIADHYRRPRIVLSYTVRPEHCNRLNNMHGGAVATLFDFGTSLALALAPGTAGEARTDGGEGEDESEAGTAASWQRMGVSRTLAVTYVRPAPCDTPVLVECELVHAGKMLMILRGIMRRQSDGAVLATCEHNKAQINGTSSKI